MLEQYSYGARWMQIKLTDALVTAALASGSVAAGESPAEEVHFSFGKIEWIYTMRNAEGEPMGDCKAYWDLTANRGG